MKHYILINTIIILILVGVIGLFVMKIDQLNKEYVFPSQAKLSECIKNNEDHRPCDLFFVAWPTNVEK